MNKYKHKIPRDDLKRFAKDLSKKLVSSDFKAGRVEDPTKISDKQVKKIKNYCKEYFDKAAEKHKRHNEERAARKAKKEGLNISDSIAATPTVETPLQSPDLVDITPKKEEMSEDEDIKMSDVEDDQDDISPIQAEQNGQLKRKRSTDETGTPIKDEDELTRSPAKKLNLSGDSSATTPPPPPPPAPPVETPSEPGTPTENHSHNQDNEGEEEDIEPMDTDIHADTNFRGKSMSDVLAQAQQEEDEIDWGVDEIDDQENEAKFVQPLGQNGIKLENPMVDDQSIVSQQVEQEMDQ